VRKSGWKRAVVLLMGAMMLLVGCGRSYTAEKAVAEVTEQYVTALTERRFEDAKAMLVGSALQGAELSFPILAATDVRQKLLGFDVKVDQIPKNATRAFATATYTVETVIPNYSTKVEVITAAFDLIKMKEAWKISRVEIINTAAESDL